MENIALNLERFHLIFLRHLEKNIEKDLICLKGGCNLRFFFKSIRYSEDIDFDVRTISRETLKNKITKILGSQSLRQNLLQHKIEVVSIAESKQTDTTQRWKAQLRIPQTNQNLPTKIEFSRRNFDEHRAVEFIDTEVAEVHKLYPLACNHYLLSAAIQQKTAALALRTETQPRDIFDLDLLFKKQSKLPSLIFDPKLLKHAIDCLTNVSYEDYQSKVVAFLMTEYQQHYGQRQIWEKMQSDVLVKFEEVLRELS